MARRAALAVALACVAAVGAACAGALRGRGSGVETLALTGEPDCGLEPRTAAALTYSYSPRSAGAGAFTVCSTDVLTAAVVSVLAEDGTLTVQVTAGEPGEAKIVVSADGCESVPCGILVRADEAETGGEEAPRVRAPVGKVYVTPSGTRWHFDQQCAGESAELISVLGVGARTPCRRCTGVAEEGLPAGKPEAAELAGQAAAAVPPDDTVYITPSGTRWHLDPGCAGSTATAVSPDAVGNRSPCKKCAV